MSDLQRHIDRARRMLAEFGQSEPSSDRDAAHHTSVFFRYGQMETLLELLVDAYDDELAQLADTVYGPALGRLRGELATARNRIKALEANGAELYACQTAGGVRRAR